MAEDVIGPVTGSPIERIKKILLPFLEYDDWNAMIIDVVVSLVLYVQWHAGTENLFLFCKGPPACGKTEILIGASRLYISVPISRMTGASLVSHYKDKTGDDYSLIKKLEHGKICVFSDFTGILGQRKELVEDVLGQLRQALDFGSIFSSASGTGQKDYSNLKFSVLAGVTGFLEDYQDYMTRAGQRMLVIRVGSRIPTLEENRELGRKSRYKTGPKKLLWRARYLKEMETIVETALKLNEDHVTPNDIHIPDDIETALADFAQYICVARSLPEAGQPGEIEHIHRVCNHLRFLGHSHALASDRREWNGEELIFLRRITDDTIPVRHYQLLHFLYNPWGRFTESEGFVSSSTDEILDFTGLTKGTRKAGELIALLRHWRNAGLLQQNDSKEWALSEEWVTKILASTGERSAAIFTGKKELPVPDYEPLKFGPNQK